MKKAFTLIELTVAVALLAMMISFASLIFDMSIDTYRTAMASAEIMQKLQAITGQLNADFKELRKDAPVAVAFEATNGEPDGIRSDRIVFFSNGDFQSTRQYKGKTVAGSVARIYYGQSAEPEPGTDNPEDIRKVILARKLQILTADDTLDDTDPNEPSDFNEYTKRSLSEWKLVVLPDQDALSDWIGRPDVQIDLDNPNQTEEVIPAFMAEGVYNFKIQLMKNIDAGGLAWWPSNQEVIDKESYGSYPPALKFTFTLYDSKGILEEGKTFTHIVYLGD